ncbi:MAG TPA: hypothetical protein RMG45_20305, partial [Polyangiaceae bacterium LLY-WYZ-15_(1-7)]|nr:hypothetical protein [Polyangiaceae bacterium LLY-WYZ-15_(1-7)]
MNRVHQILLAVAVFTAGCMTSPHDLEAVGTRSSTITFEGLTDKPNELVTVRTWTTSDTSWRDLGQTRTNSTRTVRWAGRDWYYWNLKRSIRSDYWRARGRSGYVVRVQARRENGDSVYAFDQDIFSGSSPCNPNTTDNIGDLSECLASDSPIITITTDDFGGCAPAG